MPWWLSRTGTFRGFCLLRIVIYCHIRGPKMCTLNHLGYQRCSGDSYLWYWCSCRPQRRSGRNYFRKFWGFNLSDIFFPEAGDCFILRGCLRKHFEIAKYIFLNIQNADYKFSLELKPHKGDLTYKLNFKVVPVLPSHHPSLIFSFHQAHKGHLTSNLNFKAVPVLPSLDPSLICPLHLLLSPVHLTEFSYCIFSCFLAIFISLSSNNSNVSSHVFF